MQMPLEWRLWGYDPYVHTLLEFFQKVELLDLMSECDFITIHIPLNEETRGLISRECFDKIKQGSILINTSRGAVVDQGALLKSLKSGRLCAAGLDVLEGEPDIDNHPLVDYARKNDNLIITPHCAGYSPEAVALVCIRAVQKVLKELNIEL